MRTFGSILLLLIASVAVFFLWPGLMSTPSRGIQPVLCPIESKTCPDGSIVGRTGAGCTFAVCPTASSTPAQASTTVPDMTSSSPEEITLSIGETKQVHGVPLSLIAVESDSRCPSDVQCIQAGSVMARLSVGAGKEKQTGTVSSDQPAVRFGHESVILIDVVPVRSSSVDIAQGDYRLTLRVTSIR